MDKRYCAIGASVLYATLFLGAAPALAQSAIPLQSVTVTATALPGADIDIDKVPGNLQVLSSADLIRDGSASLKDALNSNLSSISVNDDLDDPFQPDILYRGFEASPVLGTPQGLAVYQNGVRINEAFGDTVNWDLFPDIAIERVELLSASPLYGLNALGGAVSVTMKNGFTYHDADLELSGGSFGQRSVTAQYGVDDGTFGFYVASRALDLDGWRRFSDDRMRDVYAVLSAHTDTGTLDLSYTHAYNAMHGQGPAPVQELAVNRSLVFTGPQASVNRLNFLTLNGSLKLTDAWSLQGVLYYRQYTQNVQNGDSSNYIACTGSAGILCQPDGVTALTDAAGAQLPDISAGGARLIGQNDFEVSHAWSRGASFQVADSDALFGRENHLTVGAAVDYSATGFFSGTQIGVLGPALLVLPSDLRVFTAEDSRAASDYGDATPVSVDSINKNLGLFVTDTFNVTADLAVTASGRYNVAHVDLADQAGEKLSGHNRFVHFNPAIGATYRVLPTMTLYGGWSMNTRTPTASEIECSDPLTPCLLPTNLAGDPPLLRQVVAHTVELGLRGRVPEVAGGAASWNLGGFRTGLQDDIFGIATSISHGFFQNVADTRRQGFEAGIGYRGSGWSAFANYSLVQATFRSALTVPSPSNPFQDGAGDIAVSAGDRLPGIPEHRLKLGADLRIIAHWTLGATLNLVSSSYYVGDESNQLAPLPGYATVNLHGSYEPFARLEVFASISNLLNRKYATWGILSDPTGLKAPGVPVGAHSNDPGVDNRFQSPAAPFEAFGGVRLRL